MFDLSVRSSYRSRVARHLTAAAALLLSAGVTLADDAPAADAAAPADPNTGKITLSGGVDFPTQYIFRGIKQEDSGFIAQPWATVDFSLYKGDAPLNGINLYFNTWNSLHSEQTGSTDGGAEIWYESDFTMGLNFGLFDNFTAGVAYVAYTSPNDAFNTVQEIDLSLAYNDAAFWESVGLPFGGLQPSMLVAFEFDNQADGGSDKGTYLQIGIKPGFTLIQSETMPVTLSFPTLVGLSLDKDYYESGRTSSTFGYFSTGAVLSMPLAFIPSDYGAWSAYAGCHLMTLGESADDFNDGDTPDWEILGTFGFSVTY
jgi:hypothetical protein